MESAIVNARIPKAKKEAAIAMLEAMGSSPSELISRAFEAFLDTGKLPDAREAEVPPRDFAGFVKATSFDVDWGSLSIPTDYKQFLKEERLADYESLA